MRATRSIAARALFLANAESPSVSSTIFNARLRTRASPCAIPDSKSGVAACFFPRRANSPAMSTPQIASSPTDPLSVARASSRIAASHALEPDAEATREIERATRAAARVPLVETKD